jgi:hypothetical protein
MRRRRFTVRARLTLLYGAVFLVSGTALSAASYVLVAQAQPTARTVDSSGVPFAKGSAAYFKE